MDQFTKVVPSRLIMEVVVQIKDNGKKIIIQLT